VNEPISESDSLQERALASFAARDREYTRDCWAWLCDLVVTVDEATQSRLRWPSKKEYLHDLVDVLTSDELRIAIPKSRRMMVTWTAAAWATWTARYYPNHAIFIQSENEQKAAFVVDQRCAFIEDNLLEPIFRRPFKSVRTSGGIIGRMTYQETGSYIWAVPQGGSVLRTYTPSILILDEADYQPEGHEALAAAMPLVEKNAKLVLISSSNGPRGVVAQITKDAGFIRYRSSPHSPETPGRPDGDDS